MWVRRGVLFVLVAFGVAAAAAAQTDPPTLPSRPIAIVGSPVHAESPVQQIAELQRWTHDYEEWKTWFLRWRSRPEPGLWSTRARRPQPVPPPWLADACVSLLEDTGPLADACAAWREWSFGDEGAGLVKQQLTQARSALEAPQKSAWWEHVHIDGLWPMTQTGSDAIGVAGMHTTVNVSKRLAVFLAPGAILMRMPAITGGMTWSAATDWGFSYRLFDFRVPGLQRASSLHVNMVRVWLLGRDAIQSPGEMYLAGFSITFKRR